jgi:hypothetical protein
MLKKSASGVLASLRGSMYRSVRLASLLAAALLDSLFEHPAGVLLFSMTCRSARITLKSSGLAVVHRASFPAHRWVFA